jgi:uncharacterized membrane-anchored protein
MSSLNQPRALRVRCTLLLAVVFSAVPAANAGGQDADARRAQFESIGWTDAPASVKLEKIASIDVPTGCRFTNGKGAKKFLELTQNPYSGAEVGALVCETPTPGNPAESQTWFVVFEFDESGYVKDEEKAGLEPDKILSTLREGQAEGNKERRRRGWEELTLDGWERAPYYDEETNNLTWAVRVLATGDTSINHSVRLLGRRGVLKADLVSDPVGFTSALPTFDSVVESTIFVPGQKYSEWQDGDKVAAYGLTALVAGGAGAAAVKLGLFGKLWKFLAASAKLVIVALIAVGAWIKKLVSGRSDERSAART